MLLSILRVFVALVPISEIALNLLRRSKPSSSEARDRGSMRLIWIAITFGIAGAIMAQWVPSANMLAPVRFLRLLALFLIIAGLIVRWVAILTLGRLFTVDVAIHEDHPVVETGLYRFVRHPAYAGTLITFLGLGIFFENWLSFFVLIIPVTLAVFNRIVKEEQALRTALGAPYTEYCTRTKRLIPGIL